MNVLRAGLIGEHISRTRLPAALQIMCDAADIRLDFQLIDTALIGSFDFDERVNSVRAEGWSGVTVTHPYKTNAADYAGIGMVPEMAGLGAANTLVFGAEVTGYNTDYTGFLAAIAQLSVAATSNSVVMIGAGGVARSIGAALVKRGVADLAIFDIDGDRASELATAIGAPARVLSEKELPNAIHCADGLVNATPLGMAEYAGTAFDRDLLGNQSWAFDAVYTPTDTTFLNDARAAGLITLTGFDLFRHMAVRSFEAYTGVAPDLEETLELLTPLRPE